MKRSIGTLLCRLGQAGSIAFVLMPGFVSAEDEELQRFRFYGHFSPTLLAVNDGVDRYANAADNSNSGGRIGVWFSSPAGTHTFKANLEFALGVRPSATISQINEPPLIDVSGQTLRKGEVILETDRFGTFFLGQGSMGSDGVTESDLSGTGMATYVGIRDTAGGYFFRTAAGNLSAVTVRDAFPTFDGGRSVRLRWNSPEIKFGPLGSLRFVGSVGQEDIDRNVTFNDALQDMGLFYRNSVGQFALAGSAGVSITDVSGVGQTPQVAGSFSLLHHGSGINATLAMGSRDDGVRYGYGKLGVKRDFFGIGNSAFAVDYYESTNAGGPGSRADSFGFGLVQTIDKKNTDFFIGVRRHRYWGSGAVQYRDLDSVMFGFRWQFRRLERHRSVFEGLWES